MKTMRTVLTLILIAMGNAIYANDNDVNAKVEIVETGYESCIHVTHQAQEAGKVTVSLFGRELRP